MSRSFAASNAAYIAGLESALGDALVVADLADKARKMREDAFLFLRGTCFRWAEVASQLVPELIGSTPVGSVGDAHVGNFGLWRDAGSRLVWGINDFDEAAVLPWSLDLVRLAASALLALDGWSAADVCGTILGGYADGLQAPKAHVLERRHLWLRDVATADDDRREQFWSELEGAPDAQPKPELLGEPLLRRLAGARNVRVSARSAGVGSLGRPRFAAMGLWQGGPVAAEVKARLPGCFPGTPPNLPDRLARGVDRSPDPSLEYAPASVVRRLAPNARKLDFGEVGDKVASRLLRAMGKELACVHSGLGDYGAVKRELKDAPEDWLVNASGRVADWTRREWRAYRNGD